MQHDSREIESNFAKQHFRPFNKTIIDYKGILFVLKDLLFSSCKEYSCEMMIFGEQRKWI